MSTTLRQDKVAREHVLHAIQRSLPDFTRPVLMICLPVSIVVAWALHHWDSERPHAWIWALSVTPAMLAVLKAAPYFTLCFRNRWIVDDAGIRLRGGTFGRISSSDLTEWAIQADRELPGYYHLLIRSRKEQAAILLNDRENPQQEVASLMTTKFGEQAGDGDAPQRPC